LFKFRPASFFPSFLFAGWVISPAVTEALYDWHNMQPGYSKSRRGLKRCRQCNKARSHYWEVFNLQMDKYVLISKSVKRHAAFLYIMVDFFH